MAADDPELLGWDVIEKHAQEDGVFVFRHVAASDINVISNRVGEWGFALHTWSIFHGDADTIPARRRPATVSHIYEITIQDKPEEPEVVEIMSFLRGHGIKPFAARSLAGDVNPSTLVTARDQGGNLHATAFAHLCFYDHSPWRKTAWCGLVAVDAAARRSGLGRAVNDAAIDAMFVRHGAEAVVEYAAADNLPSRRMIEGSGLALRDDIVTCAATRGDARFTR